MDGSLTGHVGPYWEVNIIGTTRYAAVPSTGNVVIVNSIVRSVCYAQNTSTFSSEMSVSTTNGS